jgi:hypothetical protein
MADRSAKTVKQAFFAAKRKSTESISAKATSSNFLGRHLRSLQTSELGCRSESADLSVDLLFIPLDEGLRSSGAAAQLHFEQSAM